MILGCYFVWLVLKKQQRQHSDTLKCACEEQEGVCLSGSGSSMDGHVSDRLELSDRFPWTIFSTIVQFKMVSMHLEKPVCTPSRMWVFPTLPLKWFCLSDWQWPPPILLMKIIWHFPPHRRSIVCCLWLYACRYCFKLLNTLDLPRNKPLVRVALPTSVSAWSFPLLTYPRLAPAQSASFSVFHGFVEWVGDL